MSRFFVQNHEMTGVYVRLYSRKCFKPKFISYIKILVGWDAK